jgi:hypothetical protein
MSVITTMPAVEVEQDATGVPDGASCRTFAPERATFTAVQQKAFDRAFSRKEGKLRRELEAMRKDLLETVALMAQLLERCRDRISRQDATAITTGLCAIEREYQQRSRDERRDS